MPKSSTSKKIDRHDQIIGLLRANVSLTTGELRKSLKVSQRTLMRDLAELVERGIPIETERGRGGGIRIDRSWGNAKMTFSLAEITDLLLALSVMEKMNSPLLLKSLRSVRLKLYQTIPRQQRRSVQKIASRIMVREKASGALASDFGEIRASVATNVQTAFFENLRLRMVYIDERKKESVRVVEPYYLVLIWPLWYMQAWDHKREAIRFFRLDRIKDSHLMGETFELSREQEFKALADQFFERI